MENSGKGVNVTSAVWQVTLCDPICKWFPTVVRHFANCCAQLLSPGQWWLPVPKRWGQASDLCQ